MITYNKNRSSFGGQEIWPAKHKMKFPSGYPLNPLLFSRF